MAKEQYSHTLTTESQTPAQLLIGFFSYYGTACASPPSVYSANGSHILSSGPGAGPGPSPSPGAESSTHEGLLGESEVGLGVVGSFNPFVQCVSMKDLSQPIKSCARPLIQEIIGEWDDEVKQQQQQPLQTQSQQLQPRQAAAAAAAGEDRSINKETSDDFSQPSSSSSSVPSSLILPASSSSAVNTTTSINSSSTSTDSINANTSADDLRLKLKQMLAAAAATPSRLAGSGQNPLSSMMTMNSAVADAAQVRTNINYEITTAY